MRDADYALRAFVAPIKGNNFPSPRIEILKS
jgi:hypothetical protein